MDFLHTIFSVQSKYSRAGKQSPSNADAQEMSCVKENFKLLIYGFGHLN